MNHFQLASASTKLRQIALPLWVIQQEVGVLVFLAFAVDGEVDVELDFVEEVLEEWEVDGFFRGWGVDAGMVDAVPDHLFDHSIQVQLTRVIFPI